MRKKVEDEGAVVTAYYGRPPMEFSNTTEKTKFDVRMVSTGPNKLLVIKTLFEEFGGRRGAPGDISLKESKDFIDNCVPGYVRERLSREDAEKLKKKFEDVGAEMELR